MAITDTLILPTDVMLIPIGDLHPDVRAQSEVRTELGHHAPGHGPSKRSINTQAAALLKEFHF